MELPKDSFDVIGSVVRRFRLILTYRIGVP